jgi:hypothetical protein
MKTINLIPLMKDKALLKMRKGIKTTIKEAFEESGNCQSFCHKVLPVVEAELKKRNLP